MALFHTQQKTNVVHIAFIYQPAMGEIAFLLGCFLCQDMTFECMFSFDFTCSGKGEPLFGTGVSFHLWHFVLL